MKKAISVVLVLVMLFALCAGCGNGNNNAPADNNTPADNNNAPADNKDNNASAPADDTVYEFVVVNHDTSESMCEAYVETICQMMEEESGGRMKFVFYPGGSLYGATETLDAVKDGSADICWTCTSFYGGRFPISEFINLCQTGMNSAQCASEVFRRMYDEIPECKAEFDDWKVLCLMSAATFPISTTGKKIETPEDFKGLQVRVAGTIPSMYFNALGATSVAMATSETYESMEKGVINAICNDWHNIDAFRLYEVIDYCMKANPGYSSCFVLMNQDKYNALPDDLKAIVDKYAGGYFSEMAGYYWDSCEFWVADKMIDNGAEVYEPSQEVLDYMTSDEIVNSVHEYYINYLNEKGLDGQAIYDKCMQIVAEVAPNHENDLDTPFNYTDWDKEA